ncbi:uncharacterized protein MELLADRAFT_90715 [Melampsora larici-populina 98AG31]|uniref:Uncharacterized protein n=1 Tax=Melampsora larici-populina (strain 98AG31 / pathotype 3-4-7) TaxID=747676 RepID=F4RXX2_MELLP|nr:uncharacterized protein MELLADRAFT_90715 [Melampsora larici-populina 98AG31]EGG02806.1 hypothetical protein MELLADRAFT_90715 [Melampsora larici-populina 98AG31]
MEANAANQNRTVAECILNILENYEHYGGCNAYSMLALRAEFAVYIPFTHPEFHRHFSAFTIQAVEIDRRHNRWCYPIGGPVPPQDIPIENQIPYIYPPFPPNGDPPQTPHMGNQQPERRQQQQQLGDQQRQQQGNGQANPEGLQLGGRYPQEVEKEGDQRRVAENANGDHAPANFPSALVWDLLQYNYIELEKINAGVVPDSSEHVHKSTNKDAASKIKPRQFTESGEWRNALSILFLQHSLQQLCCLKNTPDTSSRWRLFSHVGETGATSYDMMQKCAKSLLPAATSPLRISTAENSIMLKPWLGRKETVDGANSPNSYGRFKGAPLDLRFVLHQRSLDCPDHPEMDSNSKIRVTFQKINRSAGDGTSTNARIRRHAAGFMASAMFWGATNLTNDASTPSKPSGAPQGLLFDAACFKDDILREMADRDYGSRKFKRGYEWEWPGAAGYSNVIDSSLWASPLDKPPPLSSDKKAAYALKHFS